MNSKVRDIREPLLRGYRKTRNVSLCHYERDVSLSLAIPLFASVSFFRLLRYRLQ